MPIQPSKFTQVLTPAIRVTESGDLKTHHSREAALEAAQIGDWVIVPALGPGEDPVLVVIEVGE